jgi:hypothetical protein
MNQQGQAEQHGWVEQATDLALETGQAGRFPAADA